MSAGEVITGISAGVGTAAVLYAVRLMRRLVGDVTRKIEAIVAAPAEVKELRAALGPLSGAVTTNTTAIAHLSAALERLTRIAEQRAANP